ncbi:MAG: acetylxylan esterase [Bacteroidaceae bacterium]|nr:acetylxylan esterase [Bacteroidaceae bacterium]
MIKNKLALWLLVLATWMGSSCTRQQAVSSDYVTVRDGRFYIGDQEYRYVGANMWYGAILGSEGQGGNRQRLMAELDDMKAIGIDNVRVLIGGDGRDGIPSHIAPKLQTEPGEYNDTILAGLDFLMAELEKRDMKAVLYFNNAWEWSGGYGAYLDWVGFKGDVMGQDGKIKHFDQTPVPTLDGWWEYMQYVGNFILNDEAKELAANHVKNMVTRVNRYTGVPYTESKALMAWEIANEPRCFVNDLEHKKKFVEWIDEQSTLIKSFDPNHLVTTGSEGMHGCEDDWDLFEQIHALKNIDYACIHIWPNNWGWLGEFNQNYDADKTIEGPDPMVERLEEACQKTSEYIDKSYELMSKIGRPVVLEEFGYPRDRFLFTPGSPTTGRDGYYKYVFDIIRTSGKIAGCNFWGWGGRAQVKHTIWQRWDDYVCDPAQEEQGLNSVFASDSSTLALIKEMNTRLECLIEANDSTWVWKDGKDVQLKITLRNSGRLDVPLKAAELRITQDTGEEIYSSKLDKDVLKPGEEIVCLDKAAWKQLAPGFYHIYIKVDGKDVIKNVTEVYGKQLVIDHYCFGVEPENIVSEPDAQPDFKEFWDKARAELASTPMNASVKQIRQDEKGGKKAYVAQVKGLDGDLVQIDYTVPTKPGKYPVHIINMGYSSKPWPLDLTDNGWIDVIVSSRGQGRNDDANRFGDWIQFGLDNPAHYYYRGAYLDCPRAIDYLVTLPEVDDRNIFLEGGSQGGAYSMACAALDHRVRAIACYITFMSDFPDYFRIVEWPKHPVVDKAKELGLSDEQLYRNLSYFDIKNLAGWIECPVYLGIGLQDVTCPPHTNVSGFNLLKGEKELHVYRNYGHHVDYDHWNPTILKFYDKYKK